MRQGGLYRVHIVDDEYVHMTCNPVLYRQFGKEDVWHHCFGHLSMKSLQKLAREKMVNEFNYSEKTEIQFCESCLEGKQPRKPFPHHSLNRAKETLELVHTDVCGKVNAKSLSGSEYFLTFIDDRTRYSWVYILKRKSDVFQTFREWKAMAEKSTGKPLKTLRSDNGGEYTSLEFERYLKEQGIIHQLTIPKSPQQNGVAERLNRTVMNMVRSILAVYKMPQRFWAEALNTAVYLRNRSPTTAVKGKTPFESLTGKKPSVGHLRIFGCAAYRHVMDDERKKLDPKTEKCVFLGYSENRKGYRLFDTRRQKAIHSHDVVFDETVSGLKDVKENKYVKIRLGTDEGDDEGITLETTESDTTEPEEISSMVETTESNTTESEETPSTVTTVRKSGRNRQRPDFYGAYVNMADVNSEPLTIQEALSG